MPGTLNMAFNPEYWDGIAAIKEWNKVCYGFHTEEQFYGFTEPIDGLTKDMVFLDFGCGPGRIAWKVAPCVKEYVGVDVSAGLLAIARERNKDIPNTTFVQNDGQSLKVFEDAKFDYVYERLVLIHVFKELLLGYLTEFCRVLKPNGILVIPDFPREDVSTNGFTLEEMHEALKGFREVKIDTSGTTFNVHCVK